MVKIKIKGGYYALVDDDDVQLVAQHKWYLSNGYAVSTRHRKGSGRFDKDRNVNISMHRLIVGFPDSKVDHKDRDRLNNQRYNLRMVTNTQNTWNAKKKVSSTGYTGVSKRGKSSFVARLGKRLVGFYPTAMEAAQARDIACLEERGEFAVLNFPKETLPDGVTRLPPRILGERTSKTVGVSCSIKRKAKCKWRATYRARHLGWYLTESEAIQALQECKK